MVESFVVCNEDLLFGFFLLGHWLFDFLWLRLLGNADSQGFQMLEPFFVLLEDFGLAFLFLLAFFVFLCGFRIYD